MTSFAIPVARGCGSRKEGGIYFETGMSKDGKPIEFFLIDPPEAIPANFNLPSIGVHMREIAGVWHLFDVVGEENYPNVADFIEEARRFGVSRRLSSGLDFSKLTFASRLFVAHSRAIVHNMGDWFDHEGYEVTRCPKLITGHPRSVECCAWVWWHDVDGGKAPDLSTEAILPSYLLPTEPKPYMKGPDQDIVRRAMPSLTYTACKRPAGIEPKYERGLFAQFPLGRLVVIAGQGAAEALDKARQADVRVDVVNE